MVEVDCWGWKFFCQDRNILQRGCTLSFQKFMMHCYGGVVPCCWSYIKLWNLGWMHSSWVHMSCNLWCQKWAHFVVWLVIQAQWGACSIWRVNKNYFPQNILYDTFGDVGCWRRCVKRGHDMDFGAIVRGRTDKTRRKKICWFFFAGTIWYGLHLNNILLFDFFSTWSALILTSKLIFLWFLLYLVVFISKTGNW